LIAGLGNPGAKYERTRHNAGFWFIDALAGKYGWALKADRKFHGQCCRGAVDGADAMGLKPETFMNESGQSVRAATDYFNVPIGQVLIAYDDLDLPPGVVRLKRGGGHGGHNGLRSLFSHLGDPGFWRLRIGIGHPGEREAVTPWVLSRPGLSDDQQINAGIEKAVEVVPQLLAGKAERAMQALHTSVPESSAADSSGAKGVQS
jgi:PTH1 family peptidyl-tRNA hydrolase